MEELVSRARLGDADAYAWLVAAHQEVAFRLAYFVLGDAAEAEGAAQEVFVKPYRRSLPRWRAISAVAAAHHGQRGAQPATCGE